MNNEPTGPRAGDGNAADLAKLAEQAGMRVDLLSMGAASMVYSDGCEGVSREHLERFAALVAAASAVAPAWQPIETAPKDMASRLYLCDGVIVEGFRDATGTLCVRQEGETAWRRMRCEPSHWMPRPANPVSPSPATAEGSKS